MILREYIACLTSLKIEDWIGRLEVAQTMGELTETTELLRLLCEELQLRDSF